MLIGLSTAICQVPAPAERLLAQWLTIAGDAVVTLSLDNRLPLPAQHELIVAAKRASLWPRELSYPKATLGGRTPASIVSGDRHEQRAAQQLLIDCVQLAADHGVARVVLAPGFLPLHHNESTVAGLFAESRDLPERALHENRCATCPMALDALCFNLDLAVRRAEQCGVTLSFLVPTVWPQQCPSLTEVEELRRNFDGAPLASTYRTDWAHCAEQLGLTTDNDDDSSPRDYASVWLGDASGMIGNLPLGCGEIDWDAAHRRIAPPREVFLSYDPQTTRAEVARSLSRVQGFWPNTAKISPVT